MKAPKTVAATEFRVRCLALLNEVHRTRQPLLVTRHGEPVVRVSPYIARNSKAKNPLKGSVLFQSDLIAAPDEKWDSAM
jgi:prevent-host-death family protein